MDDSQGPIHVDAHCSLGQKLLLEYNLDGTPLARIGGVANRLAVSLEGILGRYQTT